MPPCIGTPEKWQSILSEKKNAPERDMPPRIGTPEKWQSIFPENNNAQKRDMPRPFAPILRPFWAHGHKIAKPDFKNARPFMLSRKCPQKSSAKYLVPRVFAQK
jgi:hypothetical protein